MNQVVTSDSDVTATFYLSDDTGGGGGADTSILDATTLNRANADGTDRMMPTYAWWSVDGAIQLEVEDNAGAAWTQSMDFAGNSGGWVALPVISPAVFDATTNGNYRVNNSNGANFSLCIKFEKRSGFGNRPRIHSNDREFERNR